MPLPPAGADVPTALRSTPEGGAAADSPGHGTHEIKPGTEVSWVTARRPRRRTSGRVVAVMGDKARISVGTFGHYVHVPLDRLELA